jgi:hypothetical protein
MLVGISEACPRRTVSRRNPCESAQRDAGLGRQRKVASSGWCKLSLVVTTYARLFRSAPRALVTAFVLVTFLWAQHEMQRHTLQHVAGQLQRHHEQGLQNPVSDVPCIECALLAGGSHAVPGHLHSVPADFVHPARIAVTFVSRSVAASSFYSSRAPPVLL